MARKGEIVDRTGEHFISNEGCSFFIVKYIKNNDVYVQFEDEYGAVVHTRYDHCIDGSVRNPFYKSVYGIGMIGNVPRGYKTKYRKEYSLWNGMLRRCYAKEYDKYPSYKGVTVHERWHRFDLFLEDIKNIPNYDLFINNTERNGVHLDKDTLQPNVPSHEKIYAPHTVMFLTNSDNVKECNARVDKTNNNNKPVRGTNVKTGEVIEFKSAQEASRFLGLSNSGTINGCCLKRKSYKSCGGYRWEYIGDNNGKL